MAKTRTFEPVVKDGIYYAKGGDGRIAERDRFIKLYLTREGADLYKRAVRAYESTGDEEALAGQVTRAVAAGY